MSIVLQPLFGWTQLGAVHNSFLKNKHACNFAFVKFKIVKACKNLKSWISYQLNTSNNEKNRQQFVKEWYYNPPINLAMDKSVYASMLYNDIY